MNTRLVAAAAAGAAASGGPGMNDLTTALLALVIAVMAVALAWMLVSVWRSGRPADGGNHTTPMPEFWSEIGEELDRSRRFGRDFSLIRIGTPARSTTTGSRDPQADVALMAQTLRSIDRAWPVDDAILMMLPESTREQAEAMVKRLQAHPLLDLRESPIAIAAFPADGVTSGALLAALNQDAVPLRGKAALGTPSVLGLDDRVEPEAQRELAR